MQTVPQNIDLLLPYGEALRGFMEQPFITPSDLKQTLRARGVFVGRSEKRDSIPVLACCLLSPSEFDVLRDKQELREDNPKTMTRTLRWDSTRALLAALPDLDLGNLLFGDTVNYKVLGSPKFVPVANNPDNVCCEFDIERDDLSKNWAARTSNFRGKLRLERTPGTNVVTIVLTNTAEETKDLNKRFVQYLTKHFKDNRDVAEDSEIEAIRFSSFENEQRVSFFRSLTRGVDAVGFEFREVTDCGVCPDGNVTLPREVKWMEGHVNGLSINGIALQDTVFMNERYGEYHRLFLFYGMEAKYRFDNPVAKGMCSIVFEFPDFASKRERGLELEVNISSLSLDAGQAHVNRTVVKEELLRRINELKFSRFEKYRLRPGMPASVGATDAAAPPATKQQAFAWGAQGSSSAATGAGA